VVSWPSVKRAFDVAIAGASLFVGTPVLLVASAAIRLESDGPIMFSQIRVGKGRRPMRTFKLRTMIAGADKVGPAITVDGDSRVTRVGRWLRKTKVDELPQLWNVILGDMSIVGPRPEVPQYAQSYQPEWAPLFDVRPGLTDLASLVFRDEESLLAGAHDRDRAYREVVLPMKAALALRGIEQSSFAHDLKIMMETALAVFARRPSSHDEFLVEARTQIARLNETTE
jgi:lipopolysaccharide/colanic/teichoic acid biosynthesis glycosyltransferase